MGDGYFRPGKLRSYHLLIVVGSVLLLVALFLLHRHILLSFGKGEISKTLLEKFFIRTSYSVIFSTHKGIRGPVSLVLFVARDFARMFSPSLVLLTALWLGFFIVNGVRRRWQNSHWLNSHWLVLMLLGYGFLHNLVFIQAITGHDYFNVCYAPGVSLAAAIVFDKGYQYIDKIWSRRARNIVVSVSLILIVTTNLFLTQHWYGRETDYVYNLKRWSEIIHRNSDRADIVLVPTSDDLVFQYYVDRVMAFGYDTPQKIRRRMMASPGKYLFICPVERVGKYEAVWTYLGGQYARRQEEDLIIYHIARDLWDATPISPSAFEAQE